ncbi:uncharacterized protein LOC110117242 [Athalia rosae]|uniref:uncharacterized protein LOC110117242 n=1 Tax=Athalia rosae TaxID=37344 RepID=UPI0020334C76|nr:uncharacterized protein LOC110117242 [Athalia rosae]
MTYFNKREASVERDGRKIVRGYDRLRDTTPFNPKQKRCDRMQPGLIWEGIYDENMRRKVAINTSHWHGRSNRIQLDFPESKFYRSNKIQDQFYRRNNINVDSELDRQCHTY